MWLVYKNFIEIESTNDKCLNYTKESNPLEYFHKRKFRIYYNFQPTNHLSQQLAFECHKKSAFSDGVTSWLIFCGHNNFFLLNTTTSVWMNVSFSAKGFATYMLYREYKKICVLKYLENFSPPKIASECHEWMFIGVARTHSSI